MLAGVFVCGWDICATTLVVGGFVGEQFARTPLPRAELRWRGFSIPFPIVALVLLWWATASCPTAVGVVVAHSAIQVEERYAYAALVLCTQ